MKTAPILVAIMALTASVRSQNEETAASDKPTVAPQALPTTARTLIPHSLEVPPFAPPPPPVVKRLPAVRVDAAVSPRERPFHPPTRYSEAAGRTDGSSFAMAIT